VNLPIVICQNLIWAQKDSSVLKPERTQVLIHVRECYPGTELGAGYGLGLGLQIWHAEFGCNVHALSIFDGAKSWLP